MVITVDFGPAGIRSVENLLVESARQIVQKSGLYFVATETLEIQINNFEDFDEFIETLFFVDLFAAHFKFTNFNFDIYLIRKKKIKLRLAQISYRKNTIGNSSFQIMTSCLL